VVFDQTDLRTELSPDMHLFVIAQRRATNLSVSSLTSEFAETQELRLVCGWVWGGFFSYFGVCGNAGVSYLHTEHYL
jgi:hypothetical protein